LEKKNPRGINMGRYNPYNNIFFYYRGPSPGKVNDEPDRQVEDNTTKALINTLSNSDSGLLSHFFAQAKIGTVFNPDDNLDYDLQISKDQSRPDARIRINNREVYIESKVEAKLDSEQIENHLKSVKDSGWLLCITSRQEDESAVKNIKERMGKKNLRFITWKEIYRGFYKYRPRIKDLKTDFIVKQFLDYLEAINMSPFVGWKIEDFEPFLYGEDDSMGQKDNRTRVKKKLDEYLTELKDGLDKEELYADLKPKLGNLDKEHVWGVLAKPDINQVDQTHFSFILNSELFSIGIQIEGARPSKETYEKIKLKKNLFYEILRRLENYNFVIRNRYQKRVRLWPSYEVAIISLGEEVKENGIKSQLSGCN
jgi:hypothetical protein